MTNSNPAAGGVGLDLELRALAQSLAIGEPDDQLVVAVMVRLAGEPVPTAPSWWRRAGEAVGAVPSWLQNRWRAVSVAVAATLLVLLAVTPAGAKVREWLGFGAVVIEQQSVPAVASGAPGGSVASGTAAVPGAQTGAAAGRELSLEQAVAETSFPIGVPSALGDPDRVTVSADGRLVSMEWRAPGVRLDQIDGALSPYMAKTYYQDVDFTEVNGAEALWLARSHPILLLNPDGSERAESARQAGPSLVWQNAAVTLRLEGVADQQGAVAIAESLPN